jgi:hypothetical protein
VAVDEFSDRNGLPGLFFVLAVGLVHTLISPFLHSFLFELFEGQRLLSMLLALLDVQALHLQNGLFSLRQSRLLLFVFVLQGIKDVPLLPNLLDQLGQLGSIFILLLLFNEPLLPPLDDIEIFYIVVELSDMSFLLFEFKFHFEETV